MKTIIKVKELHFSNYINNISFNVNEGEILAITGPDSLRNSTLLSIIAGLKKFDSGLISICNRPVTSSALNIGYFSSSPNDTTTENDFDYLMLNHFLGTYGTITQRQSHTKKLLQSLLKLPEIILFDNPPLDYFDELASITKQEKKACIVTSNNADQVSKIADKTIYLV